VNLLVICCKYIVNFLFCVVNILRICWLYVVNILRIGWLYVVNILCICWLYVVNFSTMFSWIWTLMIIRRRVETVKCLAEFYGRPVPLTLSVTDILISSFFLLKNNLCFTLVQKCEAVYFGKYYTFHFAFIGRTSKYFWDINELYGNLKYIFF
jgi:hypothetical protein